MKQLILFILILFTSVQLSAQCETTGDRDSDGICDGIDPCPDTFNTGEDNDGDEVLNECDNSPLFNPDQEDLDGDGIGDVSDPCVDPDGDGVCGSDDICPGGDDNVDIDNDNIPDACDTCIDEDRDDICDDVDSCISTNAGSSCNDGDPCTKNDELDKDCNCRGEFMDADKDGVCDLDDICPGSDDTRDFDGDGIPDACDSSPNCYSCAPDENDKIRICHFYIGGRTATIRGTCAQIGKYFDNEGDFKEEKDHCGPCTCADAGDKDSDGDGICDKFDPCPQDPMDSDNDGICDTKDACPGSDDSMDRDDDGIPDGCDAANYCAPDYNTTWEWISKIELNDRSYTNGQSSSLELHNTTSQQLEKGIPHSLKITPEYIDDIRELSSHIYVDFNNDGDFEDSGELLNEDRSLDPIAVTLDIDDWNSGTYRMRIIVHYGRIHGPCDEDIEGEIEDLLIEIRDVQPCSQVLESFDYSIETGAEALSGGMGWVDNWGVIKEDASSQVSILTGSLSGGEGNKIGILNAAETEVLLSRAIDINLGGSSSLSFSIKLERVYGDGAVNIQLGDLGFGVSSEGSFYLEEETIGQLVLNETIEIFLQINLNQEGADDIQMWINPGDSSGDIATLTAAKELGSKLESFSININSEDRFVPSVHYIDEIQMGCDESFEDRQSSSKKNLLKQGFERPQLEIIENELSVWPNPIVRGNANVLIQGNKTTYEYQITSTNGGVVSRGLLLPGLNRLPVQQLESGVYYMTVETENGLLTKKLIF